MWILIIGNCICASHHVCIWNICKRWRRSFCNISQKCQKLAIKWENYHYFLDIIMMKSLAVIQCFFPSHETKEKFGSIHLVPSHHQIIRCVNKCFDKVTNARNVWHGNLIRMWFVLFGTLLLKECLFKCSNGVSCPTLDLCPDRWAWKEWEKQRKSLFPSPSYLTPAENMWQQYIFIVSDHFSFHYIVWHH